MTVVFDVQWFGINTNVPCSSAAARGLCSIEISFFQSEPRRVSCYVGEIEDKNRPQRVREEAFVDYSTTVV